MPNEAGSEITPTLTPEVQTPSQPIEGPIVSSQAPAQERIGGLKKLLNSIKNAFQGKSGPSPVETAQPSVSVSQKEVPTVPQSAPGTPTSS